jgi:hypothetical protein
MGVEMPSTLINVSNRLPVAETLKGTLACQRVWYVESEPASGRSIRFDR